jgi:hypothetical protein
MATLDEVVERAATTPNTDIDCFMSGADMTEAYIAMSLGADLSVNVVGADAGMTAVGVGGLVYIGVAGNAPPLGSPGLVRLAGLARCLYGATVAKGDFLKLDPTTSRFVPFDCWSGDGHTHSFTPAIVRRVVFLADETGGAITGADAGDFTLTLEWDDAGSLNAASETVTVTEIGGGRYYVDFTPTNFAHMYMLNIEYESGGSKGIVSPPGFQLDAPGYVASPVETSLKLIAGRALVAGVDGDVGLLLIQPQIF